MENYLRSKGIHYAKSTIYWPRSNGEVERYNRTLLKSIRAIHAEGKDWRSYFNSMLLDYRLTKHATTQVATAMLLFNKRHSKSFSTFKQSCKVIKRKQKETTSTPK